jgi:hypothetical protein
MTGPGEERTVAPATRLGQLGAEAEDARSS